MRYIVVSNVEKFSKKNGKKYWNITLKDDTGKEVICNSFVELNINDVVEGYVEEKQLDRGIVRTFRPKEESKKTIPDTDNEPYLKRAVIDFISKLLLETDDIETILGKLNTFNVLLTSEDFKKYLKNIMDELKKI